MGLKFKGLALIFLSFTLGAISAKAEKIKGVAICSAQCNSEVLGIHGHDNATIGIVYYAIATEENLKNTLACQDAAKEVKISSNRMSDGSLLSCMDALSDKYFGQKVDLDTEYSVEDDDSYFKIQPSK